MSLKKNIICHFLVLTATLATAASNPGNLQVNLHNYDPVIVAK